MNQFKQNNVDLLLLGVDNGLVFPFTDELTPPAGQFLAWLKEQPDQPRLALITNQGGVGLRYWMKSEGWGEPGKFPTGRMADQRIDAILDRVRNLIGQSSGPICYRCYAYTTAAGQLAPLPPQVDPEEEPEWSRDWRMPNTGMLRRAMEDGGQQAGQALFVGNNEEERIACHVLGIRYVIAEEFFTEAPGMPDWSSLVVDPPPKVADPWDVAPYSEEGWPWQPEPDL